MRDRPYCHSRDATGNRRRLIRPEPGPNGRWTPGADGACSPSPTTGDSIFRDGPGRETAEMASAHPAARLVSHHAAVRRAALVDVDGRGLRRPRPPESVRPPELLDQARQVQDRG